MMSCNRSRKVATTIWLTTVLLAGCSADNTRLSGDSFPERARELLTEQADAGAVALVSTLESPDASTLALAAEEGVRGLDVNFDPSLPAESRFRLVVTRADGNPCNALSDADSVLTVAFCRGEDAVATARADSADQSESEIAANVRRATRQLFPDEYASDRNLGIFGRIGSGVSVGIGTSIGF